MYMLIALVLALVAVVVCDVVSRRREAANRDAVRARLAHIKEQLLAVREQQQLLAALELESVTLRVIALRNRAGEARAVHHRINDRAGVNARSARSLPCVGDECQALARMAARNTSGLVEFIHECISARGRAERAERVENEAHAQRVAALQAQYDQLDEEQEAADLGYSSVEAMLAARRTPHLGYDSVDEYSLLDEDQEAEQRALCELKTIWNQ